MAVSGGADSLALLLLAHAAFGAQVRALSVDHGLRAESAFECARVAELCRARGIAHAILRWEGPRALGNVQAAARRARYALMGEWCAAHAVPWLLSAHHADDQAETLVMRLARGSGLPGLAGIRTRRLLPEGVELLRPLLAWTRRELAAVVAAAALAPVDDPSNRDSRFDRTRARALLGNTPWLQARRLAASASHLAEAEAALAWVADLAWTSRTETTADSVQLDAAGLPRELQRRLLLRALSALAPGADPRGAEVDALLDRIDAGATATLAGVRVEGGPIWQLARANPR